MPWIFYTHRNFIFIIQKHVYRFLQQRKRTQVVNRYTHFLTLYIVLCLSTDGCQMDIADLLFSATEIQRAIYITSAYPDSTALQYSSRIFLLSFLTNSNKCCACTLQVKYAHWIIISHKKPLPNDGEILLLHCKRELQGDGYVRNTQFNLPYNWIPPNYLHTNTINQADKTT